MWEEFFIKGYTWLFHGSITINFKYTFTRRFIIKVIMLSLSLLLSACSTVELKDYVHKPTHDLRDDVTNIRAQDFDRAGEEQVVIVPHFREFFPSYPRSRAYLVVFSKDKTTIEVSKARLLNKDTGTAGTITLEEVYEISEPVPETDYYYAYIPLLTEGAVGFGKYNRAKELELIVHYRVSGGKQVTETLVLKLRTWNKILWVT